MNDGRASEVLRLRATVSDLLALSTIPEAWVGKEPPAIAGELANVLIGSLQLDFVFVRLCDPTKLQNVEVIRGDLGKELQEWLREQLRIADQISRNEIVTEIGGGERGYRGILIPIGVNGERGLVAAACDRSGFPDQIDRQVLSVAANGGATAFRNASLIRELRSAQEALRDSERDLRKARDGLEVKVAERTSELRRSEKELRDVIDTIPAIVWGALPDGSNFYVNSRFVEYAGMSPEQIAGSGWHAATHPDDLPRHLDTWLAAVATGHIFETEVRFRRRDGQYRWHLCRGLPLRNENGSIVRWYGVLADIEDRRRAEQALQTSEAYLTDAQRLSHIGSWAFNAAGFEYWSSELFRIHGLDPSSEPPTTEEYVALVHPEDREFVAQQIQKMLADRRGFDFTKRIVRPDGKIRYIRCAGRPMSGAGLPQRFVGSAVDVTEQEQFEQERERLRQLEADIAHMNRISMMGEMAASLAHEVSQPIAAAINDASACRRWLTRDTPNLEEAREAARNVVESAGRAAQIIDRLRSFYKKGGPPRRELVDLNEVALEMLMLLRDQAKQEAIALRTKLVELPKVTADRVQLQQVFTNLMLNGIEAMKETGGELILASQLLDNGDVLISVSDTGAGLPDGNADQIFTAFFTTKPQGTGMGLAICRSIIESHGGRLWATGNAGPGATFYFRLAPGELAPNVGPVGPGKFGLLSLRPTLDQSAPKSSGF
jgi:PAS domain S-box-containing protein